MSAELDLDEVRSSAEAGFCFTSEPVLALLSRLEQAEQAVQRVREVARNIRENPENYNPNEYRYPESTYTNWGYRGGASAILRALDGDGRG